MLLKNSERFDIIVTFLLFITVLFIFFMFILYRNTTYKKYSKGFLVLLLFSIIVNTALSQNYTENLIPNIEGYSVSNFLSYWIIGEDRWSTGLFRKAYNFSTIITIALLIIYSTLLIVERKE